ncbi:TPA: hypothetical protein VB864_000092 [Streptococcus suis]|nr:hypothetical protein [Streptococcus suis]
MIFLSFSEILQVILAVNKRKKKNVGWVKQEAIVNSIFQFLEVPGKEDEEFYVSTSDCSKYFNGRKNIPHKLKNYLAQQDFSQVVEKFAQRLLHYPETSTVGVAKKLHEMASEQTDVLNSEKQSFLEQEKRLTSLYSQEKYTHYIATTILFSLIHIPNIPSCQQEKSSLVDSLHFNQDLEEAIQQGRYYQSYERDIIIHPDMKKKEYKVLVKRQFISHYPNPVHPHKDRFILNTFYSTPSLRSNNHFISLKINQIDYSDRVQVLDEDLDIEKHRFPYKRSLLVENLPASELYHIDLQTKYFASFPIRFGSFRLHSPAKRFKITVRIRTNEKRKLCLTLKNFGSFNKQISNIDRIEPNATMAYFENIDWTFPSSGYAYIVKPWNEFWQDFLPENQQKSAEE